MLLILSARLVNDDIAMNFGPLPPSFLPLGPQRLIHFQSELTLGECCYLTVPDDYPISEFDLRKISSAGITLLPQPQTYRLNEAINNALDRTPDDEPVRILFGDTLVLPVSDALKQPDIAIVQSTTTNYPWAFVETKDDGCVAFKDTPPNRLNSRRVLCGYFTFSDRALLSRSCKKNSFVEAMNFYNEHKNINCIDAEKWLDFGHLPLYFQSKKEIIVKRAFNDVSVEGATLVKQSDDTSKMRSEANWYQNLPPRLALHTPRFLGEIERDFQAGYKLEYLYAPLLSDLGVFGQLPLGSWLEILQGCFDYLKECRLERPSPQAPESSPKFSKLFFQEMIVAKTWSRLSQLSKQSKIPLESKIKLNGTQYASLRNIVSRLIEMVPETTPDHICFWHGDFFFGNVLYDFTARRVMTIDPRGQASQGVFCLWGDYRYDIAKLSHSIIGHYDKILLGRSHLERDAKDALSWTFYVDPLPHQDVIEDIFVSYVKESGGITEAELYALTSLLFFSLLPLHEEHPERQIHFLATALELSKAAELKQ